jgi:uncharacterized protein YjeT (DUF2065 family)
LSDLIVAIGLVAVIEGVAYAAAPSMMRRAVQQVLAFSDTHLRLGGLAAMVVGVLIVWAVRG